MSIDPKVLEAICTLRKIFTDMARFALEDMALLALVDAVRFEANIIAAARDFQEVEFLRKAKSPITSAQRRARANRPKQRMKLRRAIGIVVRNLQERIPELQENLNRGLQARNRIIHDIGGIVGDAMFAIAISEAVAEATGPTAGPDVDGNSIEKIREMRKEMDSPLQVSYHIRALAFEKGLHAGPVED